jgi:uncharacterized BrkB/YihY/UPF0761 family membrane protein
MTTRHQGRSIWAFIGFLALSFFLLMMVTRVYLLRALADFHGADERGRRLIGAHALLLLSVILAILGLSWILIFRIGRYFFPQPREPLAKTKYTDAWSESGKRMKTPEE